MTFDLKAARDALSRATERANVATDIYHLAALTYLPAALDEIERLRSLIERTSIAWLALNPGIAWEGGLDGAMVAAVSEIERLQNREKWLLEDNERLKVLQEYVKRLEEKISDFYECDATRRGCCRQVARDQAHAALDRIREGR